MKHILWIDVLLFVDYFNEIVLFLEN